MTGNSGNYMLQTQFDPNQYQWGQQAEPKMPLHQFQQGVKTDPLLDFFHHHPHFVKYLMERVEIIIQSTIHRVLVSSGLMAKSIFEIDVLKAEYSGNESKLNVLNKISTSLEKVNLETTFPVIPVDPDQPSGEKRPQTVTETLDLESEHFFKLLSEEKVEQIQEMNQANHQFAMQQGYYHPDINNNAVYTPFGVDYKTQNGWAHQPQFGEYGNPGQPQQAPGGFNNHYGGAFKMLAGFL